MAPWGRFGCRPPGDPGRDGVQDVTILEATQITKTFPSVVALDAVNVAFEPGRVYGIVGENGAGKSTLVKILDGVLQPDKGTILIEGEDALAHPRLFERISYVPQELLLFRHMTVAENLFMPFWKSGVQNLPIRQERLFAEAIPWLERFQIDERLPRLPRISPYPISSCCRLPGESSASITGF